MPSAFCATASSNRSRGAVEELLRYETPVPTVSRIAMSDAVLDGCPVAKGTKVRSMLAIANHDPAVFADPGVVDFHRDANPHIAFGAGIHFCLGAPLARLELSVTVPRLLQRMPGLRLAGDPVQRETFVLRGYHSVPVASH